MDFLYYKPLNSIFETLSSLPQTVFFTVLWFAVCAGLLLLSHFVLTLPMRRAERARLFLDLLESAIKQGRPIEETLISLAHSNDMSMGRHFHELASRLEHGMSLENARRYQLSGHPDFGHNALGRLGFRSGSDDHSP